MLISRVDNLPSLLGRDLLWIFLLGAIYMSFRFYFGGSGSGKTTNLQEYIIERSLKETDKQFIFLVPDQFTMQVQKEIVMRHPNKGIMNIDVLSFGRMYYRIVEETGCEQKILLDDTGKNLILRKVALDLADELPVLGSSMNKVGYIHEVKSVISEFMQYHISPKDVEKIIEFSKSRSALNGKLEDVNKIYKGFLDFIEKKYITTEETLDVLAELLPKSKIFRDSVIAMDGFTGFTPIQKRVIEVLFDICDEVIMSLTMDPKLLGVDSESSSLFLLSKKTIVAMEKLAKDRGTLRDADAKITDQTVIRFKNNPELAFLEQEIFRGQKHTYDAKLEAIKMYVADSPREEIRNLCIQIRDLLKTNRYAYRDIAIVTGDIGRYAPYAEELFSKYDIPVFIDETRKLILNPFTEYLKSGLRVIAENFSYESICHFLKSGMTGLSFDEIDLLENYILALKVKGKKKWERMFVRYPKYMAGDLDALDSINKTREKVIAILAPLIELKKQAKAEVITEALYKFIVDNHTYERIKEYEKTFHNAGDMVKEKEYSQIYKNIMILLEQIHSLLEGEKINIEEYIKILEAGITEISIGVIPQEVDYIVMGDIQRTRLKDIKALFFIGLNDGIIPQSSGTGGIISDIDRDFLIGAGYELSPTPREKMYIQKMYLYMNMTKPSEKLYLSYSKMDGDGKSLRPSYLVNMLHNLYPTLEIVDFSDLDIISRLVDVKDSQLYLAELLRKYASSKLEENEREIMDALYQICRGEDLMGTQIMRNAAFYRYESKKLGKQLSMALYDTVMKNSISRLERYARCAYSHFLQYGMELAERENYEFESVDLGNVFHKVLEAFGNKLADRKLKWTEFSETQGSEILEEVLLDITASYGESVLYQDAKTSFQINRIRRILHRAIFNMQYQLKKSKYHPKALEVHFQSTISLDDLKIDTPEDKSAENQMIIRGTIDRIDTYEEEDKLYVKIVDYKSRDKKIDLIQLYQGTQLQLVVYLDQALLQQQKKNPNKKVEAGAAFYYPLIDPMMEVEEQGENEEQTRLDYERWLHKQLRMSGKYVDTPEIIKGLDNSESDESDVIKLKKNQNGKLSASSDAISKEDLSVLLDFANWKVKELGKSMTDGEKGIKPINKDACKYCNFSEICNFDPRIRGYELADKQADKDAEAFELMKKIVRPGDQE